MVKGSDRSGPRYVSVHPAAVDQEPARGGVGVGEGEGRGEASPLGAGLGAGLDPGEGRAGETAGTGVGLTRGLGRLRAARTARARGWAKGSEAEGWECVPIQLRAIHSPSSRP